MTTKPAGRSRMNGVKSGIPPSVAKPASGALRSLGRRLVQAGLMAIAIGALVAGPAWAASSKVTETFSSTGTEQSFYVPVGVTSVRVRAIGAPGETAFSDSPFQVAAPGGSGAVVTSVLPVTPGETLYVEVAAGGFNGGGFPGPGGGNGGGASDLRTIPSASEGSLESRLLVAAGGGGGGGTFEEGSGGHGGDAGGPGWEGATTESGGCCGEGVSRTAGGAAGTLTGGGAGGARCETSSAPWSGLEGILGSGGLGGDDFGAPLTGGGGGGGGYFGGGGGEGSCGFFFGPFSPGGAGGGGGSSYVTEEASSNSFGLASLTTAPAVSITYATPSTATPDTQAIEFSGTQPLSTVSAPQTVTLTNNGGNPLAITGETFAGSTPELATDHPEDFIVDSSGCLGMIAFEQSCKLKVRFAPQGAGTRTATLQIAGNMGAGPTGVTLTGTGGALPKGEAGATGQQGVKGARGARGKRGPRGLTAVYTCHHRQGHGKYEKACFVEILSKKASASSATLKRGGFIYARGVSHAGHLKLRARLRIGPGVYTLGLKSRGTTTTEAVTVG